MSDTDIHGPHTHGGRQQTIHYHLQNDRFKDEIPSRTEVEFLQVIKYMLYIFITKSSFRSSL